MVGPLIAVGAVLLGLFFVARFAKAGAKADPLRHYMSVIGCVAGFFVGIGAYRGHKMVQIDGKRQDVTLWGWFNLRKRARYERESFRDVVIYAERRTVGSGRKRRESLFHVVSLRGHGNTLELHAWEIHGRSGTSLLGDTGPVFFRDGHPVRVKSWSQKPMEALRLARVAGDLLDLPVTDQRRRSAR